MERQLEMLQPLLDVPVIRRIRRNHGLEHATIHLLSRRIADLRLIGHSDAGGFWLIGDVPTELVEQSTRAALAQLRGGEHRLALHPNCGTNLVTVASLGTLATLLALVGAGREKNGAIQRIPLIVLAIMGSVVFGQPLGMLFQKHFTTLGDPADLELVSIERVERRGVPMHRITTRSS